MKNQNPNDFCSHLNENINRALIKGLCIFAGLVVGGVALALKARHDVKKIEDSYQNG